MVAHANQLISGHVVRDAQIISVILLADKNSQKGKLLQISTGEGKSTIISIFAILLALKGNNVDIITSSPILAGRDAKEKT